MSAVAEREVAIPLEGQARLCPACREGLEPFTSESLRVWGLALELDNGEPWILEDWFLLYADDYFTGVPESWAILPEGNAKTTNFGGLAVYILEHRRRAAIPWAASSREQAEIGYRQAEGFVLGSPRLKAFMKCQEGYRRIKNMHSGGRMQIFAADDRHADGIIPTDGFLDELHRHKDLRLYRTWRGKLLKRNGQIAAFSTSGEPGSEFEETRERIRQATPIVMSRPGFIRCVSDSIALHEYAVPEGGDVDDMATVKLANPFSGVTVEALTAKRASPTMTPAHWSRFVCNLPTRSESAAITESEWFAAKVDDEIPGGEPVDLGMDVAWKWDTTAIVPLWCRSIDWRLFGPAMILTPPRDGSSLDSNEVQAALCAIHDRNPISTIVMDTSRAEFIAEWASQEFGCTVIDRPQTNSEAVQDFDRFMEALRNGWLHHSGDAGLTRHALNAIARMLPQGDARFDRPSQTRRSAEQDRRVIDALTAAAMVHSFAGESPVAPWCDSW